MKRKYLNAFAGFGGNTELIDRDKWEVHHVETDDKRADYLNERFPTDSVYRYDAYDFIRDDYDKYDFVWASPDCTTLSRIRRPHHRKGNRALPDFRHYSLIAYLNLWCDVPFIVENVISDYDPLFKPVTIQPKYWIWSNSPIMPKRFKMKPHLHKHSQEDRNKMPGEIGLYLFNQAMKYLVNLEDFL